MATRIAATEVSYPPTRDQLIAWQKEHPDQLLVSNLTLEEMMDWYKSVEQVKKAVTAERVLRARIFKHYFTAPKEGTNKVKLPDGATIEAKYPIKRDVEEAVLEVLKTKDPVTGKSPFESAGISDDKLVKWKPSLSITHYRELTEEQMKVFDQCLKIEPGSISLEIVPPKPKD